MDKFNQLCPFCRDEYMEPVVIVSDPYEFTGLFYCENCKRKTYVYNLDDEIVLEPEKARKYLNEIGY